MRRWSDEEPDDTAGSLAIELDFAHPTGHPPVSAARQVVAAGTSVRSIGSSLATDPPARKRGSA